MKKYIVFSRWTPLAGPIPDETRRGWEEHYFGRRPVLHDREEAERFAKRIQKAFQSGFLETYIAEINLSD